MRCFRIDFHFNANRWDAVVLGTILRRWSSTEAILLAYLFASAFQNATEGKQVSSEIFKWPRNKAQCADKRYDLKVFQWNPLDWNVLSRWITLTRKKAPKRHLIYCRSGYENAWSRLYLISFLRASIGLVRQQLGLVCSFNYVSQYEGCAIILFSSSFVRYFCWDLYWRQRKFSIRI